MSVNRDRNKRRKMRVRGKLEGTAVRPRVSVFRSNKYMYAQAIDDAAGRTVAHASSVKVTKDKSHALKKSEAALAVGEELGRILLKKKIELALFDRGRFAYHGRVAQVAEGLRKAGIKV